jgi:NAD(P)-dependent dehydrogenase (short-subunit alcohol dehydrogenase family)
VKSALVTGATSRLGAPLAAYLAHKGFRVLLHAKSSAAAARDLAVALRAGGAEAEILMADFAQSDSAARFCSELIENFGAPDVIVNNASLFSHDFPGRGDADILAASLDVHVKAPFRILEAVARTKQTVQTLTIFNILDQKLINPNPDYYSYTLGKAALLTMTELWQLSGRSDIRVFGLLPGLMFPSGPQSQERFAADSASLPTGRATSAESICAAIGFYLDHPDMPGQIVPIDGGEHLRPRRRDIAFE